MDAIYTPENCRPAYQLNWSLTVFGKVDIPNVSQWLKSLSEIVAADGVRILEAHTVTPSVVQFLVSTVPKVTASQIVRSVKGRWQHLVKDINPSIFRRNYRIDTVGAANSAALDRYVAGQNDKHPMVDRRVQDQLIRMQYHDSEIDLTEVRTGNYGQFVNGLQIVFENAGSWNETQESVLMATRAMIVRASRQKHWLLSRIGLLSNHIHVLLGIGMTESPEAVALSLLNNLASVQEMRPVFKFSYYVGTFGAYDRAAIRSQL